MPKQKMKVVTPDNLGQGIVYNPATKQFEVHFVSEAEIEQVQNYVDPQEDDERYLASQEIKLRDRNSGFMWTANKQILKDRAPAMDEDATVTVGFTQESGKWYINYGSGFTSNIDGEIISGSFRDYVDLEQFHSTEELNTYLSDKKAQFVTNKRFANSLNGKPMIRSTVLEASYLEMSDDVIYANFSASNDRVQYDGTGEMIGKSYAVIKNAMDRGEITITGTVTYGEGEHRGETKTFNVPSEIIGEQPYIVFGNLYADIGSYSDKHHYTFTASPKTITLHEVGYTYHVTLNDFDNGVVIS